MAKGRLRPKQKAEVVILGIGNAAENWSAVLRDLKGRGMNCRRLVTGDGHLGSGVL